jgi:hypothetical protein
MLETSNTHYDLIGLEFVCPCRLTSKMKYTNFINHIFKIHKGKTPKFYMQRKN